MKIRPEKMTGIKELKPTDSPLSPEEAKYRHFLRALKTFNFNVSHTARELKIHRNTANAYIKRLKALGVDVRETGNLKRN